MLCLFHVQFLCLLDEVRRLEEYRSKHCVPVESAASLLDDLDIHDASLALLVRQNDALNNEIYRLEEELTQGMAK